MNIEPSRDGKSFKACEIRICPDCYGNGFRLVNFAHKEDCKRCEKSGRIVLAVTVNETPWVEANSKYEKGSKRYG